MPLPTLLDIAKRNGSDPVVGLIDEAATVHPEIRMIAARTIKGVNFKTLVRVGLPTVSFRDANNGTAAVKSRYEERLVSTYIVNPRFEVDKAVADASEDGAEAYLADEAIGISNAAFATVASQVYYGGDASGFPALPASIREDMVVDAGGTTANTGSSVWALSFGPKGVQWAVGDNGSLELDDPRVETITGQNGLPLTGYVQELLTRIGLQVGNLNGLGQIRDLTEDANKGLNDDLLADLLGRFRVGYRPDVLLMSRRSLTQLKKSRTATNPTGAPAPTPSDYEGIPIVATDSIVNTEALAA